MTAAYSRDANELQIEQLNLDSMVEVQGFNMSTHNAKIGILYFVKAYQQYP